MCCRMPAVAADVQHQSHGRADTGEHQGSPPALSMPVWSWEAAAPPLGNLAWPHAYHLRAQHHNITNQATATLPSPPQPIVSHSTVCWCVSRLQGCSGQQEQDTALLLQMAGLLQAMERQRGSTSRDATPSASQQESASAVPSDAAVAQLLTSACSNLAKLTSDSMQLFAADLNDVLKTYRWGAHGELLHRFW